MEAFSLLRYWRGGGGGVAAAPPAPAGISTADTTPNTNTAILAAVAGNDVETDDEDNDDSDDGPFFDLEFTLPDEAFDSEDPHQNPNENQSAPSSENHSEEENDSTSEDCSEREIKFTLSPSSNDHSDPNLSVSDDVFLEGKLVQLEPSSFVLNSSSEPNSKPPPPTPTPTPPQFTAALLKSATKFRVFMLGLKKPKPSANASSSEKESDPVAPKQPPQQNAEPPQQQRKLFTVKFKVEEVPIMSLFTRDSSSRAKASASNNKGESQTQTQTQTQSQTQTLSSASDDKRLVHKYLRMVKPLYIRVSRKYAEKLRFSGQLNVSDSVSAPPEGRAPQAKAVVAEEKEGDNNDDGSEGAGTNLKGTQKQGNLPLPAGLRVVCKHLGKSRSASSAAAPATSGPAAVGLVSSRRRDDSLLQQQDGIQGAILHCKRSFNASRECESSQLPRSVSDPLHEVSPELSRKSMNEGHENRT